MKYLVLVLSCICVMSGCSLFSSEEPVVVTNIDEEVRLDLWHPLGATSNVGFALSTLEPECAGTTIATTHFNAARNIQVSIHGLVRTPECADPYAFATAAIPFTVTTGGYHVVIDVGNGVVNEGSLQYDGNAFTLDLESNHGLTMGYRTLRRIPEGTVWGALSSQEQATGTFQQMMEQFSDISNPATLAPGYYDHFSVDTSNVITLKEPPAHIYIYTFALSLDSDTESLRAIVDALRNDLPESVEIRCLTWSGLTL